MAPEQRGPTFAVTARKLLLSIMLKTEPEQYRWFMVLGYCSDLVRMLLLGWMKKDDGDWRMHVVAVANQWCGNLTILPPSGLRIGYFGREVL